jgi:biotin operon repressor
MPKKFAAWWARMSSDLDFRRAQEKIMAKALGADAVPDLSKTTVKGEPLAFPAPGVRQEFNKAHDVATMLAKHGYVQHGERWAAPDATGAPGVRQIPGKQDLWQSDHGSDPLHGTFDAWAVHVVYDHDYKVDAARDAWSAAQQAKSADAGKVLAKLTKAKPAKKAKRVKGELPKSFMVDELDTMQIPATRWLVDGLIAPGLTLLAAPPKQGKSYLALQMCLSVAAGKPFLGRTTSAGRVAYFDLEEWHALLKARVDPISKGHGIVLKGLPLAIKLETGVGDAAIEDIETEIAAGAKLVVVDLLARIRDEMSEDARKNVYTRDYAAIAKLADFALRQTGVAIVVVHHANKGAHDDWQAKISGSFGLTGATHANLYLARPDLRGMTDEEKEDAMRYRVLHAVGKMVEDQEVTLEMMDARAGWKVSDVKPWEISTTRKQKDILLVLHQRAPNAVTSDDVAKALGLKRDNVRKIMFRMAKTGVIESDGRGGEGFRLKQERAK